MSQEDLVDLIYEVTDLLPKISVALKELDKEFLTNYEYENDNDLIWELPRVSRVSKHGQYIEYAITKISKGGDITAKGIGEDYGEVISVSVDELNYEESIGLLLRFN